MDVLGQFGVQTDGVRIVERVQISGNDGSAKEIECKQYLCNMFLTSSRSGALHFQMIFTRGLTLNDKAELILLKASGYSLPTV